MTKKLTVYVSGPMSGVAEHNFPAFFAAEELLNELGHTVINPATINPIEANRGWRECMRYDIIALLDCDAIATLPGWKDSRGASLEVHIGKELGLDIFSIDHFAKQVV